MSREGESFPSPIFYHFNFYGIFIYMCRIIALKNIDRTDIQYSLDCFRLLAENGNVPQGARGGHRDGWGIGGLKNGAIEFIEKESRNALRSKKYLEAVDTVLSDDCEVIIGHLRKSSVGGVSIQNTHPFLINGFLFCQNGTIFESEKIKLKKKFEKLIQGNTDSERFFAYIMQCIEDGKNKKRTPSLIQKAIIDSTNFVRKNFDYTALNFVLTDGKYIWAFRGVNEKNKLVMEKMMLGYYTLYQGMSRRSNSMIISSEKIDLKGMKWKQINNHELIMLKV